jgi:hypothetical protein
LFQQNWGWQEKEKIMKNELSAPFPKYPMVDALIIIFKSAFMV